MLIDSPADISRADASLPTRWGDFGISVFRFGGTEVVALVRGEVVEVQGHLIAVRIEDSGRFPHILKGVAYFHGAVVWTTPAA